MDEELIGIIDADSEREYRAMTAAEREMSRLKSYILEYPFWDAGRATYISAGLDPEETILIPGDNKFIWLPGGLRKNWLNCDGTVDPFTLEQHVLMELEYVSGFVQGVSRPPVEWIEYVRPIYPLPWLDVAAADATLAPIVSGTGRTHKTSIQALGGAATRDASSQNAAKMKLLAEWDRQAEGFSENDFGSFTREMIKRFCDDERLVKSQRTIAGWIGELKEEKRGGSTPPWAARMRNVQPQR